LPELSKPSEIHALAGMRKEARSRVRLLAEFFMAYTDLLKPTPWRQFHERHPNAVLWLIAFVQAGAMLGLNVVLRALVS
jgi:hypothetical protein